MPLLPTTQQVEAPAQATPLSAWVVPDGWAFHVVPPLVVRSTVPRPPTAQPVVALAKVSARSDCVVPDFWAAQDAAAVDCAQDRAAAAYRPAGGGVDEDDCR